MLINKLGLRGYKTYLPVMLAVISALLLSGCSTAPRVHSLYEQGVDFSQYRSFAFASLLIPQGEGYTTLVDKYLQAAISRELMNRGLHKAKQPEQSDLMINYKVDTQEKTKTYVRPAIHSGYYGSRGYYGYTYGMRYGTDVRVHEYTEGTLNIDVVDRDKKQLIWEGVAVGRLKVLETESLEADISEVVGLIFEHYP